MAALRSSNAACATSVFGIAPSYFPPPLAPRIAAMADKPRYTHLTRALSDRRWKRKPLGMPIPPSELATNTFIPRLSWKFGPQVKDDGGSLIESLKGRTDVALFLDASFVTRDINYRLWDELLCEPARLRLIERVLIELAPHFAVVPRHPLRRAIAVRNRAIVAHPEPNPGAPGFSAMLYYLNLLCNRRTLRDRAISCYEREHGTPADEDALSRIESELQSDFRERGQLLYTKPLSPIFTDEVLVYLAVAHAVRTGQHTIILTGDRDVEEQFFKLVELITMHYLAMLLAREYAADTTRFHPRSLMIEGTPAAGAFEAATLLTLDVPYLQVIKPTTPTRFVSIASYLQRGEYVSHLPYGAETAMSEVLDVKDRTGGRSTDLLGEEDLHVYFLPPVIEEPGHHAIVSRDVVDVVPGTNVRLAKLDSLFAINVNMNMATVVSTFE
jgi:hypothetical protein